MCIKILSIEVCEGRTEFEFTFGTQMGRATYNGGSFPKVNESYNIEIDIDVEIKNGTFFQIPVNNYCANKTICVLSKERLEIACRIDNIVWANINQLGGLMLEFESTDSLEISDYINFIVATKDFQIYLSEIVK